MILKIKKNNYKACPAKLQRSRGYVLIETLFYIALFVILSLATISAMITMTKAFKETTIKAELMKGSNIMERISREIRQADSINSISAGSLKLNTKDDAGVDKTVTFLLSGSNIQLLENDVLIGNLNTPNILVDSLVFTEIITVKGKAVKIFLTIRYSYDSLNRTEDFYDTIKLRGDY